MYLPYSWVNTFLIKFNFCIEKKQVGRLIKIKYTFKLDKNLFHCTLLYT